MAENSFPHQTFDDLLAANSEYQKTFKYNEEGLYSAKTWLKQINTIYLTTNTTAKIN